MRESRAEGRLTNVANVEMLPAPMLPITNSSIQSYDAGLPHWKLGLAIGNTLTLATFPRPFRGAPFAGHEYSRKWRQQWLFVLVRVGRQARIRVRRACRARQGAADAPRRARRSLKTARDADAADRHRRFDMPCRRSWSRASAKFSATLRETKLEGQGLRPKVSGSEGKEVKGLGQNPDSPGQRP